MEQMTMSTTNNPYNILFIARDKDGGIYTQCGLMTDESRQYRYQEYRSRTGHTFDHDDYVFCNSKDPIQVQRKFNEVLKPWMRHPSYIDLLPEISDSELKKIALKLKDSDDIQVRLDIMNSLDRQFNTRAKKEGFVYLMESDNEYKIGVSTNVWRRSEDLNLQIVHQNYSLDSYMDEAKLQVLCSKYKSNKNDFCSEYFAKDPAVKEIYEKYFA